MLTPEQQAVEKKRQEYLKAKITADTRSLNTPPQQNDEEAGEEPGDVESKLESIAHPEHTADDLSNCLDENKIRANDDQFDILHNVVREAMAASYKSIPFNADGELMNAAQQAGLRLTADQMKSLKDLIQTYIDVVDENKGESYEDSEEAGEACTGKSDCPCPKCTKERSKEREEQIKTRYDHLNDSVQITNFIKALSQKNYASANKYLQGVVEGKLKRSISNAYNK